jgi:uncharacterized membrane protein
MNNRFLLLFVSFVLAIALVSFASANIAVSSVSNIAVNPGTNVTGQLTLTNTNSTYNITGLRCTITSTFSTKGITSPTEILAGLTASPEYSVYVPAGTTARTDTVTINAEGILNGTAVSNSTTFNITVNTYPSLSISWITEPSDVYQGSNASGMVNITNNGNVALDVNLSASFANTSISLTPFSLSPSQSVLRNISINTSTKTPVGSNTFSVSAVSSLVSATREKSIEVKYNFCPANSTTSPIYIEEVTNKDTLEDKDFKPSDSFTVKLKVKNTYTDSKYVAVKAVLMKSSQIDDTEEETSPQKISSDSTKSFSLNITIPSDLARGDYYLFVKAYDDDKSTSCDQKTVRIHIDREDHEMALKNVEFSPSDIIECDNIIEIKGTLENLGSKYEDQVKLAYSDGVFSDFLTFTELDSGDVKDFSFSFSIPKNATEKAYTAYLRAYYDYDDNDGVYGDSQLFTYTYAVSGNCFKEIRNVSVSSLSQTAFISKDSDVTFALTNAGNVPETYTISATSADFTVKSITPSTILLPAGSTTSISLKVAAKEGTTPGMHNIALSIVYSGKTESKTIGLNVQKESTITGAYNYVQNKLGNLPWLIIFNVVLALVIIFFIVKLVIAKPKAKAAPAVNQAFKSGIKKNFK